LLDFRIAGAKSAFQKYMTSENAPAPVAVAHASRNSTVIKHGALSRFSQKQFGESLVGRLKY
jgi:hypothetical protein